MADGLLLVFEVEAEHVLGLFGGFDGLGGDGGHAAEVVDVIGEGDGVGELFGGVDFELAGDVHVLRALENLRVVDVGDDGLIFAGEIFVEEVDEFFACEYGLGALAVLVAMSSPCFLLVNEMREFCWSL